MRGVLKIYHVEIRISIHGIDGIDGSSKIYKRVWTEIDDVLCQGFGLGTGSGWENIASFISTATWPDPVLASNRCLESC
jgi:hypothetical protein